MFNNVSILNGLSEIIDEFINDRRAQNLAKKSILFYSSRLREFEKYINQLGIYQADEISSDLVRSFILHLQEKGHNSGGVHSYYRTIRAFLNFYENEFEPPNWKNPIKKVKSPRVVNEPLEGIGVENAQRLMDVCDLTPMGIRNKTIVLLLLETGVRAQELLDINVTDIDFVDSSILIRQGKGRKPRSVFMGSTAKKCLRKHLRNIPDKGALFISREGDRLKYGGLKEVIKALSLKAGLPPQRLHDFRRTYALQSLRNGVDIHTLSKLMGHTSLQVLSRYLRQTKVDLGNAYKSLIDS